MTRLELQLTDAERRQEQAGRLRRFVARARAAVPSRSTALVVAAAAALLVAVVAGIGALSSGGDENAVAPPRAPSEIARLSLGEEPLGDIGVGYGSLWIGGIDRHDVVRVDPVRHRIVARIHVGEFPTGMVPAAGALWVAANNPNGTVTLQKIDPAGNRIVGRFPVARNLVALATPSTGAAGPWVYGNNNALWLLGAQGGVRIDPRSGAVARVVRWKLGGVVFAEDFALGGDDLWVHATDGRLLRYDARSGARTAQLTSAPGAVRLAAIPGVGVVVRAEDGTVTRFDAATGRAVWKTRLGGTGPTEEVRATTAISGGSWWGVSENPPQATARLTELDLGSGRTLSTTALKETGDKTLTAAGDDLWLTTATGELVAIGR